MATADAVQSNVEVQELLEAGLHFGHQTKRWNPKMKPFIFGERNGIYIIDLIKSKRCIKDAQKFIYDAVVQGRSVLFVGTKKQAREPLKEAAERLNQYYVTHRWLGGMLTNNQTIRQSVKRMREIEAMVKEDDLKSRPKKEAACLRRELTKLQRNLSGVADMDRLPGVMFVVDVNRESIAVAEANRLGIPVVAMLDTNCNPDPIDFPIPGNDDAIRAIRLITKMISDTILQASNEYAKMAAEEARRRAAAEAEAQAKAKAEREERKAREAEARKARAEALAKAKEEEKAKAEAKMKERAEKEEAEKAEAAKKPEAAPAKEKKEEAKAEAAPAAPAKEEAKEEPKAEEPKAEEAAPAEEAKAPEKAEEAPAEEKSEEEPKEQA